MKKKKYDTSVIMLYLLRQEHLLPKEFRKTIPYSTISSWRKSAYQNYEGSQFRFLFDDNWDTIRLKYENQKLRRTLMSITRSYVLLKTDVKDFIQNRKNNKEFQSKIVLAVNLLRPKITLELSLKMLFLHRNQFYEWAVASRQHCTHSFAALCLKRYPRQLQRKEVDKIKSMLTSPSYEHWPIVSIAGYALRKGHVVASLYSWYKYARILNLAHKSYKKSTNQVGLLAERPNEYLHIDTTYYYLSDTKKVCITMVMDNFSKMILGFAVADRLSFDLIKSAIKAALPVLLQSEGQKQSFLVSDGGRENNNSQVNQFIAQLSEYRLSKVTALKDIHFSNSPVEAIHKIIKGRYLQNKQFETLEGLTKFLNEAVYDYNNVRPHYKHFPKTPAEVYFQPELKVDFSSRITKAVNKRVRNNLTTPCRTCRKPLVEKFLPTSSPLLSFPQFSSDLRSIVDSRP